MKIERIKIEGYRSLKSVEWKPEPLNVLIGANASGKSNFLHALELLPAAANGELEDTILKRGGMAPLLWDGTARRMSFEVVFINGPEHPRYSLVLRRLGDSGSFEISDEKIVGSGDAVLLDRMFADFASDEFLKSPILSTRLSESDDELSFGVQQAIRSWAIYHDLRTDQRAPVRQSAVTRQVRRLDADGQNLVPVLFTLYNDRPEFEQTIDKAMAAAFPDDYEKLKFTPLEDSRVWLRVRWKGSTRQPTVADLSDGTLRFLMLLAILANPDPPPLIAIDEPKAGLHPRMLPIIAELAAGAASRSQVILSTHSPEMLDAFRDQAPAVTVFHWVENRTELKTLAGAELKRWIEDYSLGRFAFSGEAEAIP